MDFERKRILLNDWIELHKDLHSINFSKSGESLNKRLIDDRIKGNCSQFINDYEYIYLLCITVNTEIVPVYVGKSVNPVTRWRSHVKKLLEGMGSYARWKIILLTENNISIHTLSLLIIPEPSIETPPIPNFPKTVGSVEYQLVSLVSDAYPDTLLNKEGNRR